MLSQLDILKQQLDPHQPNEPYTKAKPLQGMDLNNASLGDFKKVSDGFKSYFNEEFKQSNTQSKIDAIWLYMAFSLYVHHWANDPTMQDAQAKLQIVNELDRFVYPFIQTAIHQTNLNYHSYSRRFYQQILQINANLFVFAHLLNKNNPEFKQNFFDNFPLSFSKPLLEAAKKQASNRRKNGDTSIAEKSVNKILLSNLPQTFQAEKNNVDGFYIDKDTGLELDFPLKGKITIETDGIHHQNGEAVQHEFIHNFKSFCLRENGWTRVPVNVTSDGYHHHLAQSIADSLNHPETYRFSKQYQELISFRTALRNEMIQQQSKIAHHPEIHAYLNELMRIDADLNQWIKQRHLEIFLRESLSEHTQDIFKKVSKAQTNKIQMTKVEAAVDALLSQITMSQSEITESQAEIQNIENQVKQYEATITTLREKMQYHTTQLAKIENELAQCKNNPSHAQFLTKTIQEVKAYLSFKEKELEKAYETQQNMEIGKWDLESDVREMNQNLVELTQNYDQQYADLQQMKNQNQILLNEIEAFFNQKLPASQLMLELNDLRAQFEAEKANFDALSKENENNHSNSRDRDLANHHQRKQPLVRQYSATPRQQQTLKRSYDATNHFDNMPVEQHSKRTRIEQPRVK